ncbi:Plasmodium vivax Vir protein, putative [Plasmodium vivax]|nr:Plasmodium vivax Vir protein, putative [Plasmodium vivax]
MKTDKNTYTLKNFLPKAYIENNELNETVLNKLYQSYFESDCVYRFESFDTCYPDEREETLPQNLRELYKKFERNIILLCDKSKKFSVEWEKNEDKLCFYLKYWIYDQLISNNVSDAHFSQFFKIWNENKGKNYLDCGCKFNITHFLNVKLLKKIYDYFLFLEAYEKTAKINEKVSNMNYCKYIEDAKAVYTTYPSICETSNTETCQEFKKYISPYMKKDDDTSILCMTDSKYNPDQEDSEKLKEALLKIESRKIKEQINDPDETEAQGDTDQEAEARKGYRQHLLPLQKEGSVAHGVLSNGLPQGGDGMINQNLVTNSPENGSPTKTIASASLVGVPSIIFLLYKFSPIRTWLDPRIRKTKSELMNSAQGSNELQSHDYNFDTTNMDFNRFNVGYQSR